MQKTDLQNLVSPITHKTLISADDKKEIIDGIIFTDDNLEQFDVIKGTLILLPKNMLAEWCRELMEVLLWEYPEELNVMLSKIDHSVDAIELYLEFIKKVLKDKEGVIRAFEKYSDSDGMKWILTSDKTNNNVPLSAINDFNKYNTIENGEDRVNRYLSDGTDGWAFHIGTYVESVLCNKPQLIVELSTGAGFGTASIAYNMSGNSKLYTIDIGFACGGNAVGIAKYLNKEEMVLPIVSNYWFMPFRDCSIDTVCAHYGLDESREIPGTIKEVERILKPGGRFVCIARKNAFDRQANIMEPLGFTKNDADPLFRKARLYSGPEDLFIDCENSGLSLVTIKEFKRPDSHERVVMVFIKDS